MSRSIKNWEKEYSHHCQAINETGWSTLDKDRMKKRILKILKRDGAVNLEAFPPEYRWNLCSARLKLGDYGNWDGWEFRSPWSVTFQKGKCPIPKWDGSPVKHLVVLGEQGIGDEILYLSALPDLMVRYGKGIEWLGYPKLNSVVERSFRIKTSPRKLLGEITEGDAVLAVGDLFRWYRTDYRNFPKKPFLKADPVKVEYWKNWLSGFGDKKKIGIAWFTRKGYIDPGLLKTEDAVYFDLQYRDKEKPINLPSEKDGPIESVPFDTTDDMENLFAFVKALDYVNAVTQTICHIAGSQGVKCNAIIPPTNGEVKFFLWYYGLPRPVCESPVYSNMTVYSNIDEFRKIAAHEEKL